MDAHPDKDHKYPGQFTTTPDFLHVVIPHEEIMEDMMTRGEHATMSDVCLSVVIVADAIATAAYLTEQL